MYRLYVCKCVLYFCHRVTTQLQLTNISFHSGTIRLFYKIISNLLEKIIPFTLLLDRQDSSLRSWVSLIHFPQIYIRIPLISHPSHIFSPSKLSKLHYLDFSYLVEISNFLVFATPHGPITLSFFISFIILNTFVGTLLLPYLRGTSQDSHP